MQLMHVLSRYSGMVLACNPGIANDNHFQQLGMVIAWLNNENENHYQLGCCK